MDNINKITFAEGIAIYTEGSKFKNGRASALAVKAFSPAAPFLIHSLNTPKTTSPGLFSPEPLETPRIREAGKISLLCQFDVVTVGSFPEVASVGEYGFSLNGVLAGAGGLVPFCVHMVLINNGDVRFVEVRTLRPEPWP